MPEVSLALGPALGIEAPQAFRTTGWGTFVEASLILPASSVFSYALGWGWWRLETAERHSTTWLSAGVRVALQPESRFFFRSGLTAGLDPGRSPHPTLGTFFGAVYRAPLELELGLTMRADIAPFKGALLFSIGFGF